MPRKPGPERVEPTGWKHFGLWRGVRSALYACPDRFSTPTNIEGLMATDIFTLNTALAATIEDSMVKTLNYWLHERRVRGDAGTIASPSGVSPYPMSKSNISDKPSKDSGNFGRLVRYGVMDDYIAQMQSTLVRGIAVRDWQSFFKAHLS